MTRLGLENSKSKKNSGSPQISVAPSCWYTIEGTCESLSWAMPHENRRGEVCFEFTRKSTNGNQLISVV
jgi:hypothetical protein